MRAARSLLAASLTTFLAVGCVSSADDARPTLAGRTVQSPVPPSPSGVEPPPSSAPDTPAAESPVPPTDGAPTPPPPRPPSNPVFVPEFDRPIPHDAGALAAALVRVTRALRTSTARWLKLEISGTGRPPEPLELQALYEQRIDRVLMRDSDLTSAVLARLPSDVRTRVRLTVAAMSRLIEGVHPVPSTAGFRTGPPEPPGPLLRDFLEGERRIGTPWEVLAAVMYVESKFGRARSASSAGAQGPMQFLPSTWEAYGMGGDIHDPHDAILGAANYLHANGSPGDDRRALYAYNHSDRYVDAVLLLAERLRREPESFVALYAWQVFVVTVDGDIRLTGPGTRP